MTRRLDSKISDSNLFFKNAGKRIKKLFFPFFESGEAREEVLVKYYPSFQTVEPITTVPGLVSD
jgi:hypothetical protein